MDSILNSIKKQLGLEKVKDFDEDIIMQINAAISTLTQLGVGPKDGYVVINSENTYSDFLGENHPAISQTNMYLYYKTKYGFDPPLSSAVMEALKNMISEAEWRLRVMCEYLENDSKKGGDEDV